MRRVSLLWLGVILWALALALATGGYFVGQRVFDRGVAYGATLPTLPDLDTPQRAINTQLELEPDLTSVERSLKMIKAAGFGMIRQQFAWAAIEGGGKGQFFDTNRGVSTWERYDQIVRLARENGLQVLARVDLPPEWARPPDSYKTHPPTDVRDYGDFLAAFTAHYANQIGYVQLWNEPNLNEEWGRQPVDPAGYVELLKAGSLGAKRGNPVVRVVSAALAQTLEPDAPGAQGLDDLIYLDRLYDAGAQPYFDVLAVNAYGLQTGPGDRRVAPAYTNFPRVLLSRQVMERHGDAGKAVWVAEFGWNALPPNWQGQPSPWGVVTPAQQAQYIQDAYQRARVEWPWMGTMALWLFRKPNADPRDPTPFFALVRGTPQAGSATAAPSAPPVGAGPASGWEPSPAYLALAATADTQPLGVGVHQESDAGLTYRGTWQYTADPRASLGALKESPIPNVSVSFTFQGTSLDLLAPMGPGRGIAYVKVNGSYTLVNRLPLNAHGQATLDLYAPTAQAQQRIPIVSGLPDGVHTVEITVSGEHTPASTGAAVALDALVVARSRSLLPMAGVAGGWTLTGLVIVWWARTRWLVPLMHRWRPLPSPPPLGEGVSMPSALAPPPSGGRLRGGKAESLSRGALAALVAVWRWPWVKAGVLFTIAVLPLAPLAVRTPGGTYSPVEIVVVLTLFVYAVRLFFGAEPGGLTGAFAGPAALFVLAGVISLAAAAYPHLALRELRTLVIEPALFYVVARQALRGRADGARLASVLVTGATAAATLALLQTGLHRGLVQAEGVARAAALYASPNNLALLLDRATPLAFAAALYAPRPTWGGPRSQPWAARSAVLPGQLGAGIWPKRQQVEAAAAVLRGRLGAGIWWGAVTLCLGALFVTYSRGAWLATGAALLVVAAPRVFALRPALRRRLVVLLVAGLPLALLLVAMLTARYSRFRSLFSAASTGLLRVHLWGSAMRMALDHPWFGVGLDQFLYYYPQYIHPDAWREPNLSHPHNFLLDFWLRLGIPGLAALSWGAVILWRLLTSAIRFRDANTAEAPANATRSPSRSVSLWLRIGVTGTALAFVLHGLVDNSYFVLDLAYATWAMLLLAELAGEPAAPREST